MADTGRTPARHERDYIERTIATVRNHRDADNCWPQWANIFADEIEALWAERERLVAERDEARADTDEDIWAALSEAQRRAKDAEARMESLREALAETGTHVHDCEEVLTPATRRAISESVAAITDGAASSETTE